MARAITSVSAADLLAGILADGAPADPLTDELAAWLAASARFRGFAEANRDKIRKKLRGARADEGRRDVRAELHVAYLLLSDARVDLAFEAYGSGRRGPDFTISYRTRPAFNLEVTRMRRRPDISAVGSLLLAKLRQLPPSLPNAVLLAVDEDPEAVEVEGAVRELRRRADRKDEAFFVARGYEGTRSFYERYLRLGGVYVLTDAPHAETRARLWLNPSARIALPGRPLAACLRGLQSSGG